jgi:hypothetical protein
MKSPDRQIKKKVKKKHTHNKNHLFVEMLHQQQTIRQAKKKEKNDY